MSALVFKDGSLRLRLIPPGKKRIPWFASTKTYPWIGSPTFCEEMTEAERDKLYEVYQEEGLESLHDAVMFLDKSVWFDRRLRRKEASVCRGRNLMEGR